jgi:N-acetylglucosamine kinase-like BadF-type ATPase
MYLGVDAGGTKTHAVLTDENGVVISEATSGPGNPLSVGEAVALISLRDATRGAITGYSEAALRAAHFGMAGAGRPTDAGRAERLVRSLDLPCPVTVSDDAKAAFYAAADPPGVVLVCGTGSLAVAYAGDGRQHRSGGHGYLLGDEGSGYWIGREAVRAALRSADGRGEPTALVRAVPALLGLASLEEVVSAVYAGGIGRPELAALAAGLARLDDTEIARIFASAADELVLAVRAALSGAGIESEAPALVLSGGLLRGGPLRRSVEERLKRALPHRVSILAGGTAPAMGAARLARRAVETRRLRSPL